MIHKISTFIRYLIVVIGALVVIIPPIVALTVILWLFDLPRRLGVYNGFKSTLRNIVFKIFNPEEMRLVRNDVLDVLEVYLTDGHIEHERDRWGLLREIDEGKDEVERQLRDGEILFSLIGSASAILVGTGFGMTYGGVVLTLVVLLVTLLVSVRIIITDALCFNSINHQNEPIERLVVLKGWNNGPINGKGAIAIAIISAVVSRKGLGYNVAMDILDRLAERALIDEDKWKTEI